MWFRRWASLAIFCAIQLIASWDVWSSEIDRLSLSTVKDSRQTDTNNLCFMFSPDRPADCFQPVVKFEPLQIRVKGQWDTTAATSAVLANADAPTLAILRDYREFHLTALALDSDHRFVAKLVFDYGPDQQTNYVFGQLNESADGPWSLVASGYADADPKQELRRQSIKNFDNIVHPDRNFQAVDAQVRTEDIRRALVTEALLRHWVAAMGKQSSSPVIALTSSR